MENMHYKLDDGLIQALDKLSEGDEIDVLIYPKRMGDNLKKFLTDGKNDSKLNFNILELANCIAVKAGKSVILDIAAREDVARLTMQPRFTAD